TGPARRHRTATAHGARPRINRGVPSYQPSSRPAQLTAAKTAGRAADVAGDSTATGVAAPTETPSAVMAWGGLDPPHGRCCAWRPGAGLRGGGERPLWAGCRSRFAVFVMAYPLLPVPVLLCS